MRTSSYTKPELLNALTKLYGKAFAYPKIEEEYQYSVNDRLTVECPIHGEFKKSVKHLLDRSACPRCGRLRQVLSAQNGKDAALSMLVEFQEFVRSPPANVDLSALIDKCQYKSYYRNLATLYNRYRLLLGFPLLSVK